MDSNLINYFKHKNAVVESSTIGKNTRIWANVHIFPEASIGENCNICEFCLIENKVVIGSHVTIKSGVYLWDGVTIEDNAFIGPNVVFTNDLFPRSKKRYTIYPTLVKKGASIGANSTLLAGIIIGEFAMIGIGSVVTKNVLPFALVYGNPAKQYGWVDKEGNKMVEVEINIWKDSKGNLFESKSNGLEEIKK